MPTVIDSLLIELGLDSTKFEAAQKKAVEALRKFDEANQKSAKGMQENNKKASEGVLKTKDAIDSLNSTRDDTQKTTETVNKTNTSMGLMGKTAALAAVALAGFKVLKGFSLDLIDSNAQLGRTAALLSETPQQITAWGTVLKGVGGTADDFTSSMQNIEGSLARLKMGFGGTQILRPLGMLGVALSDASNPDKIQKALQAYSKIHGEQQALVLAQELGINGNTFQAMINRSGTLKSQYAQGLKSSNISTAQTDKAEEQLRKIAQISAAADGAKQVFKMQLDPTIDKTLDEVNKLGDGFNNLNNDIKGVLTTTAAVVGGLAATGLAIKALRLLMPAAAGAGGMAARVALMSSRLGSAGLALGGGYAAGTGINYAIEKYGFGGKASIGTKLYDLMNPASKSSPAITTSKTFDGSTKEAKLRALESKNGLPAGTLGAIWQIESRQGKNAGLSKAGALGDFQFTPKTAQAFGITDRKDFDQSSAAAAKYLAKLNKQFKNPAIAAGAYNWGEGNMAAYLKTGAGMKGQAIPSETIDYMAKYNQQMGAGVSQSAQGMRQGGGATVETNIQAINIHTQATDAAGIAKSARQALYDHQLIGTATLGVM